jgi:hypothetical protein
MLPASWCHGCSLLPPARCPLQDSATLIFKAQAEVAFREQTAGHNALLLFVHLSLAMLEQQLVNAFRELRVKQAEVGGGVEAAGDPALQEHAHAAWCQSRMHLLHPCMTQPSLPVEQRCTRQGCPAWRSPARPALPYSFPRCSSTR